MSELDEQIAAVGKKKEKKHLNKITKIILAIFIVIAIIIIGLSVYLGAQLRSYIPAPSTYGSISMNISLTHQDVLSYIDDTYYIPYALFNIKESNATKIVADVAVYANRPPKDIYVLNWSNDCFSCGKQVLFLDNLTSDLTTAKILNGTNQIQMVSQYSLTSIKPNSILIIPTGLLPDYLLSTQHTFRSPLYSLLQNGTIVIYIGRNFSRVLSQNLVVPASYIPSFLNTSPFNLAEGGPKFYFPNPTFAFRGGSTYGPVSYEQVGKGYLIAFSNYPTSWQSQADEASDVASIITRHFWIRTYASGFATLDLGSSKNANVPFGVLLNDTLLPSNPAILSQLESGVGIATFYASTSGPSAPNAITNVNRTVYFTPSYSTNGTVFLPNSTFPGIIINSTITLYAKKQTQVEPRLDIYTRNMQYVTSVPPFFSRLINGTFTAYVFFTIPVGTGSYIAELNGFTNQHYASAYFTVPQIRLYLYGSNFTNGSFEFAATAIGHPISNVTATVSLNGQYRENVTIENGEFLYQLPKNASVPTGNLNFMVYTFHTIGSFSTTYQPPGIYINKQYIEFIIALVIVMMEVTLVKAPSRDEFYIDITKLPGPPKTGIKLKYAEVLGVFDKLNLQYKWKFMPLSMSEIKYAISTNMRSSNMPVNLTFNNIELLLDNLVQNGYIVKADDLYAPVSWIEQSKHDIDYLATFKKLRIYLVAHARGSGFTDMDKSDLADIVTTLRNERAYIVIYSQTSRFIHKLPIQNNIKTYLAFLNGDKLDDFKNGVYSTASPENEQLKMFISTGMLNLISAENPEEMPT